MSVKKSNETSVKGTESTKPVEQKSEINPMELDSENRVQDLEDEQIEAAATAVEARFNPSNTQDQEALDEAEEPAPPIISSGPMTIDPMTGHLISRV